MKKILLGTSAIISAVFTAASANAAGKTPEVTVGGFANFQAGYISQDRDTNVRSWKFQNDDEIHFKVDAKADNGLQYGAVIELEADVSADADGQGFNADKTFVFLQGGWGRAEMGANSSATQALTVGPAQFARATGGINGDWYNYANLAWGGAAPFIITADLPVAHGAATSAGINGVSGASEDAAKITYYTPRFSGFQLGVSYTPDAGNSGTAAAFTGKNNGDYADVWNAGVNYNGKFQNIGLAASLTGEIGSAENTAVKLRDLRAWQAGVNLSWMNWSLGGSYGDWGKSTQAKNVAAKNSNYWTAGIGYETGPYGASVTYLDSTYNRNKTQNISVGADYKLAPGLVPYAEVSFFDLDLAGTNIDNKGTVVLVGTHLNF